MNLEEAPTVVLPSDVEGIIGRAWPEGLHGQDLVDWHMLAPVAQNRAVRRLAALLRLLNPADDEEPFETTADAAKAAGMGLSTFYSMMKRWKDSPSLSSLGVHAKTPVSRRTARGDEREAAEKFLCSELTKDSGLGTLELVRRMNDAGYAMPKSSAVRLIGIARREVSAAAPFGGRFAIDSAGMDMIDSSGDRMRIWATLHPASGLILGWLIETEGSGSQTYGLLARKTLNCLPSLSLEGLHATGTAGLEVRMPPSDMVFNHFVHPRMTLLRSPRTVADRQTGGLILRALGDRLAHVWIGQGQRFDGRSYRTGRIEPMPIVSMVLLENISWSIELHNRECIDRMPKDGDSAMLQVTLNALRVKMNEIIGTVDDLEARLRAGRNT